MTILEAMTRPQLFGPFFQGDTWAAWRVFLAAVFGLPMSAAERAIYERHTQRTTPPTTQAREAWMPVGRRGGKSRIAAFVAAYLATFRDYTPILGPGEMATIPIIAADRKQARVIMRFVKGMLTGSPVLKHLVTDEYNSQDYQAVELATNRTIIEVHTASYRTVRGYLIPAAILEEVAFLPTGESANPDTELVKAIRPGMATVPDGLLIGLSSPYWRHGVLWTAYQKHFGRDGDPILVWQADTRAMNPSVPQAFIDEQYAEDPAGAAAEYGAQFRTDIAAYVTEEVVDACVVTGRYELPRSTAHTHIAFVDPSGGSVDSMTLAIGHAEERSGETVAVVDCIRETKAPFSPKAVVRDFAATLALYGVTTVVGDAYAGEWPREQFHEHGITYDRAEKPKVDLYRDALPALNSGRVELLDLPRLKAQLCALERRTARGGRDSIDHPPGGHDDVANAVAGIVAPLLGAPKFAGAGYYGFIEQQAKAAQAAQEHAVEAPAPTLIGREIVPPVLVLEERLRGVEALERRMRAAG